MSSMPPTAKQLKYLRVLAERTGRMFATPTTRRQASSEIRKLEAFQPHSRVERRIERAEVADAIAARPSDAVRVRDHEIRGWGSTATWSQRS